MFSSVEAAHIESSLYMQRMTLFVRNTVVSSFRMIYHYPCPTESKWWEVA